MNIDQLDTALEALGKKTKALEIALDKAAQPARKSALRRFPIFFALATAFGAASVFFGFERLLMQIPFIADNPLLLLVSGIVILMLTGTIYKKL